jgi:hypothetical protein
VVPSDDRGYRETFRERVTEGWEAAAALPADGPVRAVLSNGFFEEVLGTVETEADLASAFWPPLLMFVMRVCPDFG